MGYFSYSNFFDSGGCDGNLQSAQCCSTEEKSSAVCVGAHLSGRSPTCTANNSLNMSKPVSSLCKVKKRKLSLIILMAFYMQINAQLNECSRNSVVHIY